MTADEEFLVVNQQRVEILDAALDDIDLARRFAAKQREKNSDECFTVLSVDKLLDRVELWRAELPNITPFYAVKCHPDPVILGVLSKLELGFDCASSKEIEEVLRLGVAASRIIYANPCKPKSHLKYAAAARVDMMTFDSIEELAKIREIYEKPFLVLRIAVSDPSALCQLNKKFGVDPEKSFEMLDKAKADGFNISGVSFHIGSGARDSMAYERALFHASKLYRHGLATGHDMQLLDIGGGFPGSDDPTQFREIAGVIRRYFAEYFGSTPVRVIAEPGRFFAAGPILEVVNVIHAAVVNEHGEPTTNMTYFVNDSIFGSFNCKMFDHVHPRAQSLKSGGDTQTFKSTIWGQTCDGDDKIEEDVDLPKLDIGDWLLYQEMGAYTQCAGSAFNGYSLPHRFYTISEPRLQEFSSVLCE